MAVKAEEAWREAVVSAERTRMRWAMPGVELACPACGGVVRLRNPSVRNRRRERLAGGWCEDCKRAWRAIERPGDGWRVCWDVAAGEKVYVLNGREIGQGDKAI